MKKIITIEIPKLTILQLIKCNVLVAEISNDYIDDDYIYVTKEEKNGYVLYTYETITDESLKISITFDKYMLLEIKE